jgi:hypothetical protein
VGHAELGRGLGCAAAAPGSKLSIEPTGASITGMRTRRPSRLDVQSIFDTSRSTRGRKAIESSAWRLRLSVVSVSAPPIR